MKKDILQEPWTKVEVEQQDNSIAVKVWGREYVFRNSIFPCEIKTAEQNILAEPIAIRTFFDDKEEVACDTQYYDLEYNDAGCEFGVSQCVGNIILNARVNIEFDGLIRVKFCVVPFWNAEWDTVANDDPTYRLNRLFIDIPIKKQYSKLYHYYPNAGGSTIVLFTNDIPSGNLPEEGIVIPFKPYTWLGWEDGGLSLCCEKDKNLELSDKNCAMEYINEEDRVTLRVHLLDHLPADWQNRKEMWADAALPIEFEYGLQATPVKPRPNSRLTKYQIYHMDKTSTTVEEIYKEFEESEEKGREFIKAIADKGTKYFLVFFWARKQNYWKPGNDEKFRRFIRVCQSYGIEPIMYFGYEYSTAMEDWFEKGQEYLQKNTEGRLTDGWLKRPPLPWSRAYTMCLASSYSEVFLKNILESMDKYGFKCIYLDGTFNFWECANEAHGCGYIDRDGKKHHTYPVFAVREFAKKLHNAVQSRGGFLYVHQSGTCSVPTMSFSDVVLTGESVMRKLWNKEISLDMFRAEHSGLSTGINVQWIGVQPPEREEVNIEYIACMPLLHGVMTMPRMTMESLDFMSKVWNAHQVFGIDDSEFFGYWQSECPVKLEAKNVYASAYKKADKILAVVSNIGDEEEKIIIHADGGIKKAHELITGSECVVRANTAEIVMKPNTVRMIELLA